MTSIIICEKPSQAADVRKAVGTDYGRILPCEGHLLRLAEPKEVNEEWGPWGYEVLKPPAFYPWRPDGSGGKKKRLADIHAALRSAAEVTIATDCDREGQLIGQSILEHFKFKGKVFRAIFTAQDPVTLKTAFKARRPNDEFRGMFDAAVARQQSDQVYGMTLTRAATLALRAPGETGVIGIGRVKTATLAIACRRELGITNFKPTFYYEVTARAATAAGELTLRHAPEKEEDRILDRAKARDIAARAEGFEGPLKVERKKQRRRPPRLPDLPALQKKCGAWGWSADRTLEVAQALYEKHLITYPRSEAGWLAENQIGDVGPLLRKLAGAQAYAGLVPAEPVIRKGKQGHFCDKCLEGVSHHAVIPNVNGLDGSGGEKANLAKDERHLFDYVARSFIAALLPDYEYEATRAVLDVHGHAFAAKGSVPLVEGWRAAWPRGPAAADGDDDGEQAEGRLPPVKDGDGATLSETAVEDKETRPPARFHEGALIEAMQNAWKFVDDEGEQERLREAKGIGTPATRASIIEGLKKQDLLMVKGKHIVPTGEGLKLYRLLVEHAPDLVDPGTTARWELRLDEVLLGKVTPSQVWDEISAEAGRQVTLLREAAAAGGGLGSRPPTDKMLALARDIAGRRGIALPEAVATSFQACRAFLDEHAGERREGADLPSAKQLAFAEKLAGERGIALPEEARADRKVCSAFIDAHMKGGASRGGGKSAGKGGRKGARRAAR